MTAQTAQLTAYRWTISGARSTTSASGAHGAVEGDLATVTAEKKATTTASVEGTVEWKGRSKRPGGPREEKTTDQAKGTIELAIEP